MPILHARQATGVETNLSVNTQIHQGMDSIMPQTNNYRILVVDDNAGFLNLLSILLEQMGFKRVFIASNYATAIRLFHTESPDICLLDIELGESKNGIELGEEIRSLNAHIPIIFLTANYTDDYYEKSRHVRPSSFMNKELSRLKLHQAIDLALVSRLAPHPQHPPVVLPQTPPLLSQSNLFFKIGDVYKSIPIEEIAFFYSEQKLNYAKVGKRNYPTNVQLKTLEDELKPGFARIHKSYLINIKHVEAIHPAESSVHINGEALPIGYAYRKNFLEGIRLIK